MHVKRPISSLCEVGFMGSLYGCPFLNHLLWY
nr:MAG TPA: hypothetical protein [Caudoviricetes sp.]